MKETRWKLIKNEQSITTCKTELGNIIIDDKIIQDLVLLSKKAEKIENAIVKQRHI